jgi:hypothetical protein
MHIFCLQFLNTFKILYVKLALPCTGSSRGILSIFYTGAFQGFNEGTFAFFLPDAPYKASSIIKLNNYRENKETP